MRLRWEQSDLEKEILRNEIGIFGALFGDSKLEFHGKRVKPEMRPLIERCAKLGEVIQGLYRSAPPLPRLDIEPLEKVPWPYRAATRRVSISGVETLVDLSALELSSIETEIASRKSHEQQGKLRAIELRVEQRARERDLRAKAAQNAKDRRREARRVPAAFERQLAAFQLCPYCQGDLNFEDAHLDHIYPVSKGGLSTKANMVFVCASCNSNKRDMTLRRFVLSAGLDEDAIYASLDLLEKDH